MSSHNASNQEIPPIQTEHERELVWINGPIRHIPAVLDAEIALCLDRFAEDAARVWHSNGSGQQSPVNLLWLGEEIGLQETGYRDRVAVNHAPQSQALRYLGTEQRFIVFNAFSTFDVNAFAAICGTLIHGGFLILVTPPVDKWRHGYQQSGNRFLQSTASASNIQTIGQTAQADGFMMRFAKILQQRSDVTGGTSASPPAQRHQLKRQPTRSQTLPRLLCTGKTHRAPHNKSASEALGDQRKLINTLKDDLQAGTSQVFILTADRGRGKSACLGIFLAEWLQAGIASQRGASTEAAGSPLKQVSKAVVTGPARQATHVLFKHLANHANEHIADAVEFHAPDSLLETQVDTELLVVDEAARLPLPILKALIRRYPKLVLATTVHGYEGAGRGFALRLSKWLDSNGTTQQWLTLNEPVRWLAGDALEHLCNELFLFKAALPEVPSHIGLDHCQVKTISRANLAQDKALLEGCFALLLQAHYRTRPVDLQHLLGEGNLNLDVLLFDKTPVALVWWAEEGGFTNPALCRDIVRLQRRPHGHLLPQLMAQWVDEEGILEQHYVRIVRIAVHPKLQRRGLGTALIEQLHSKLTNEEATATLKISATGAVFGADPAVVAFWKSCGFQPFHLSAGQSGRSGMASMAVIRELDGNNKTIRENYHHAHQLYNFNFAKTIEDTPVYCANIEDSAARSPQHLNFVWSEDKLLRFSERFVDRYLQRARSFHNTRRFIVDYLERKEPPTSLVALNAINADEKHILQAVTQTGFSFTAYAESHSLAGKQDAELFFRQALEKVFKLRSAALANQ